MRLVVAVFLLVLTVGSSSAQEWRNWQSKHHLDHPLVGLVYHPGSKSPIKQTPKEQEATLGVLTSFAAEALFLLIGEQHDNPDHHRIQAWFLNEVSKRKYGPAVVFEMVPRKFAKEINVIDLESDPQLDKFAERLEWEKRNWPSWSIYRPVALAAARNNLRLVAGNLDRDTTSWIAKIGLKALPSSQIKAFGLAAKLPQKHQTSLDAELMSSHCNFLPEHMIPAMRLVQRARDGSLAEAMISARKSRGSVLIAGNGHVRKDRGVPAVLHRLLPDYKRSKRNRTMSIGLIEVRDGKNDPTDYNLINEQGEPLYDAVIFTPKANTTDHCAALRKQFEKKKSK